MEGPTHTDPKPQTPHTVGCACMSWRLGHHTQIQEELTSSWLARSLVNEGSLDEVPAEDRVIIHFSTGSIGRSTQP
jgi:hypothetical protein